MKNTKAKSLNIAYIGGGSRAWAWTFMTDLSLEPDLGGTIRLYDTDESAAKSNELIGNRLSARPASCGKWTYKTTSTLKEALTGADFIIISILPGTFAEMKSDVHLPERLGIYQSVGDTAGPGGAVRALRTIPLYVGFAQAIREYAPDAWVINYTNPMSLCVRALYHTFPEIKALGCCHEVFGTQTILAEMVEQRLGLSSRIPRSEIHINVMGLNHFTWFDRATYQDLDLFKMYADFVREYEEKGYSADEAHLPNQCFSSNNRVKMDLFKKYGWIAAAGDRHLAEFMPWDTYLKDPEAVEGWGYYLTSVDWRMENLQERLAKSARLAAGEEEMPLTPSGEEGILLIKALSGLCRVVSNVNLPNTAGQIANLPRDTVVETNALFSYDSVRPVMAGQLSEDLLGLIQPHVEYQADILQAALDCDRNALYAAFLRDPLMKGRAGEAELCALADDMVTNTLEYLPQGWRA